MVVVSMLVHVGALGLAVSAPAPRAVAPPQVISVELVADPSKPAAPARLSPPKPKIRKPKKTVLPAKPSQPKPAKPKPERRREVFLDPAPKTEKSLEDLLAEMREEQGEPTPAPSPAPTKTAAAPSPSAPSGIGQPVSPELLDWVRRAKLHVRRAWVVPPGFRMQTLETHVVVTLDESGKVVGTPQIARRSGNPWYDEGVVRGIEKASPLPPPPEAGDWDFVFVPEDSF